MPGEHVREEPDGQGERPDQDVGQDLDRRQDDQHRLWDVLGDHVGEVAAQPLVLDAEERVGAVDHQHQRGREGHHRRRRELEDRDDLHQVHEPDEEEQRDQERQEAVAALAHHRPQDLVLDEVDAHLAQVLEDAGHEPGLPERGPEERHGHDHGDQDDQDRLGEGEAADGEERREDEAARVTRRRVRAVGGGEDMAVVLRARCPGERHDATGHVHVLQVHARAALARAGYSSSGWSSGPVPPSGARQPPGPGS